MSTQSYFQNQHYQAASRHFQRGEWRAGLAELEQLIQIFPLEQELRSMRRELLFKERLDGAQISDLMTTRRIRWVVFMLRMAAVAVFVVASYWAISTYSDWIGRQVADASQQVEHEIRSVALSALERDATALIQVGRLVEAEQVLQDITAMDPDFPGLTELNVELGIELGLSRLYDLGMQQIDAGDWLGAKESLEQLAIREPTYRDVRLQLMYIDRQTLLGKLLNEGEAAAANADWEQAVARFETVRSFHPDHDPVYIEARLFESYVNAGRAVLIGQEDSLAALEYAEAYLRKALALRPQDPDIKRERELAGLFLMAQGAFDHGNWTSVIDALGRVVDVEPEYAQGTARQTLYDAYVARGELQMYAHSYEEALNDFERAVSLGKQDEGAALRLYEAELKLAEAYGATGNFEAAVVHYRAAVEWGGLAARSELNPALLIALQEAETYASLGNFGVAYERFQRAVNLANADQLTRTHVVQEGEYLTLLASRYGSTVRAIVEANDIENRNLIFPGQELMIPVLP